MSVIELRDSVQKVVDSEDSIVAALVPWSAWAKIEDILEGLERIYCARHPDVTNRGAGDNFGDEATIALDELLVMVNQDASPLDGEFFEEVD